MLQMLTFTGSIFVLETNIYNKYEMHIYNKNCRYVSLHNENNYIYKVCINHIKRLLAT